jgi:hypothetical protein
MLAAYAANAASPTGRKVAADVAACFTANVTSIAVESIARDSRAQLTMCGGEVDGLGGSRSAEADLNQELT